MQALQNNIMNMRFTLRKMSRLPCTLYTLTMPSESVRIS